MHFKKTSKLVNFCSHFNIVEEKMQHFQHIMPYYFKKCKNATEMQKTICAEYGACAVIKQMCQKWFVKFHAEYFCLDNVS